MSVWVSQAFKLGPQVSCSIVGGEQYNNAGGTDRSRTANEGRFNALGRNAFVQAGNPPAGSEAPPPVGFRLWCSVYALLGNP